MSDTPDASVPEEREQADPELDEIDDRIARSGIPAIYIDTWFLTTWRGHMRVTFGERVSHIDAYRSAIVLELRDAERLAHQMLEMVERRKAITARRGAPPLEIPDPPGN